MTTTVMFRDFFIIFVCVFLLRIPLLNAVYIPLQDTQLSYPLLRDASSGDALKWSVGNIARLRLTSSAMRISSRGVRFIPGTMNIRPLGSLSWTSTSCTATEDALCKTARGSPVFPESASSVLIPPQSALIEDPFTAKVGKEPCRKYASRLVGDTDSYTISLCDITQKGFDFVLHDSVLYYLDKNEALWYYLVLGAFTVVLVTAVAQNIAHLLGETSNVTSLWLELLCVALSLVMCLFAGLIRKVGMWNSYTTVGDQVVFLYLLSYIAYHLAYWICIHFIAGGTSNTVPVNIMLATLLLTLCTLYDGMENDYVAPVLFMLLTRAFFKAGSIFMTPVHVTTQLKGDKDTDNDMNFIPSLALDETKRMLYTATQVVVLSDFLLAAIVHQYGFRNLFEQQHMGDAFFIMMTLFAYSLSVFVRDRSI